MVTFHSIKNFFSAVLPSLRHSQCSQTARSQRGVDLMTANTVAYARLLEDRRHNQALERETNRANLASEGINTSRNQETQRHNVASEGVNWFTAQNLAVLQAKQGDSALMQGRASLSQADTAAHTLPIRQQEADTKQHVANTQRADVVVKGVKTGADIIAGVWDRLPAGTASKAINSVGSAAQRAMDQARRNITRGRFPWNGGSR